MKSRWVYVIIVAVIVVVAAAVAIAVWPSSEERARDMPASSSASPDISVPDPGDTTPAAAVASAQLTTIKATAPVSGSEPSAGSDAAETPGTDASPAGPSAVDGRIVDAYAVWDCDDDSLQMGMYVTGGEIDKIVWCDTADVEEGIYDEWYDWAWGEADDGTSFFYHLMTDIELEWAVEEGYQDPNGSDAFVVLDQGAHLYEYFRVYEGDAVAPAYSYEAYWTRIQ
jgi:hypothetical protein